KFRDGNCGCCCGADCWTACGALCGPGALRSNPPRSNPPRSAPRDPFWFPSSRLQLPPLTLLFTLFLPLPVIEGTALFETLLDGRAGAWPTGLCGPRVAAPIDPLLLTLRPPPPPIPPTRVGAKRVLSLRRGADCWFTWRSDMRRPSRDALKGS